MNFSTPEFLPNRQRCRQWIPLITQQFRLRHLCQILGLNLSTKRFRSFYFTLHLTSMSAPFYTSEKISSPNPRWKELDPGEMSNTSASCIVLRVWHNCSDESNDQIVLTWGVHFSGLVYLGNKIADIRPLYFKPNTVIFSMFGGYYTSLKLIRLDLEKSIPFLSNLNAIDIVNDKAIYKRVAIKCPANEIQVSYNVEKLKKVQYLQIQIKKRSSEVQNIQEKINVFLKGQQTERDNAPQDTKASSSIRYAPQLLTMNCLNKLLQEKPSRIEKQEMIKVSKEIELIKFKTKLLSQEKDKKSVLMRQLKQKFVSILEENDDRNTVLMNNYHKLSKGSEKLKEFKKDIVHHKEIVSQLYSQLQYRKKQLLKELLFIYPIEKVDDNKYTIHGIYLPNSDKLADSPDIGLSVALGYITHILIMCSTFLQVPLRYPLTHYGSRSYVTDGISPLLSDREREFPLFTRGKDKVQFTYAVYLLNKNIAQFRWLLSMNTHDLKATLSNLLTLLQNHRDLKHEPARRTEIPVNPRIRFNFSTPEKYVGLHSFGSNSNISDPILDWLRDESSSQRLSTATRSQGKKSSSKSCRSSECGKGLNEILTIPEAYLNKQINSDSLRNFMVSGKCYIGRVNQGNSSNGETSQRVPRNPIKISTGNEVGTNCDITVNRMSIEEGTDTLDPRSNLTSASQPVDICDSQLLRKNRDISEKQNRRLSRSVGSYSDEEFKMHSKSVFEIGSEPLLNQTTKPDSPTFDDVLVENSQHEKVKKLMDATPCSSSNETIHPCDVSLSASPKQNNLLTERTDALLTRKSFNLVKPKL